MILGPTPRITSLDFLDIHYHACSRLDDGELCHTSLHDDTSKCHRYLAGFVLCRAKPLIVAVTAVRGDEPKSDAVERLLDHVLALGLTAPLDPPVIRRGERIVEKLETSISHWPE